MPILLALIFTCNSLASPYWWQKSYKKPSNPEEFLNRRLGQISQHLDPEDSKAVSPFLEELKLQEVIWLLSRKSGKTSKGIITSLKRELSRYMQFAEVKSRKLLGGGSTKSYKVEFSNGIMAIYKPKQKHPSANSNSEVGAYVIDQLLNTHIVPITIFRSLEKKKAGSLQYFIKGAQSCVDLNCRKTKDMYLLDYIIENSDRDRKNFLYVRSINQLVAIDHGWSLRKKNLSYIWRKGYNVDKRESFEKKMKFPNGIKLEKRDYLKLRGINKELLGSALEGILGSKVQKKIMKRRDKMMRNYRKQKKG